MPASSPNRSKFTIEDIVHDDSQKLAKQFCCSICLALAEEPVQTACQHIYCASCLAQCRTCPQCRTELGEKKGTPLRECNRPFLSILMDGVKVRCPYHDPVRAEGDGVSIGGSSAGSGGAAASSSVFGAPASGPSLKRQRVEASPESCCDWEGSYGQLLEKHLGECLWQFVLCPDGCGAEIRRRDLAKHRKSCAKLFVNCGICGASVKPKNMAKHRSDTAELHVQILEERLKSEETTSAGTQSQIGTQLSELVATVATRNEVGEMVRQETQRLERKMVGQLATMQSREAIWDLKITDVFDKCAEFRSRMKSPEFYLGGCGPFQLVLYPRGQSDNYTDQVALLLEDSADGTAPQMRLVVRFGIEARKKEFGKVWGVISGKSEEFRQPGGTGATNMMPIETFRSAERVRVSCKLTKVRHQLNEPDTDHSEEEDGGSGSDEEEESGGSGSDEEEDDD